MTGPPVVAFIPPSCCGAGYFRRVRRQLADLVDCRALELPGHGRRYDEQCRTDPESAVADLAAQLGGPVDAVYGESLGAYLGLALVTTAARTGGGPVLLIAGANMPPGRRPPNDTRTPRSPAEAAAAFAAMGGGRIVVAEGAFPLVRADLLLSRALIDRLRGTVIDGDIRVLAGVGDPAAKHLRSWAAHTRGRCSVTRIEAGHLMSADAPAAVAAGILAAVRPAPPAPG